MWAARQGVFQLPSRRQEDRDGQEEGFTPEATIRVPSGKGERDLDRPGLCTGPSFLWREGSRG